MKETITPCRKAGYDTIERDGTEYQVAERCEECGEPVTLVRNMMGHPYTFACQCECSRAAELQRKIGIYRERGIADNMCLGMRFESDKGYNPGVCRKAKNYVANWPDMKSNNVGLLFTGGVGTGKTYYAACIANELIDNGVFALMTSLSRMIRTPFEEYGKALKTLEKAELVIFDDVGAERDTSFAWERAFDAVDIRIRANKPIIVTTNLSPQEMGRAEDIRKRRIYDRILGACTIIPVTGTSIRAKEKQAKSEWVNAVLNGG